MQLRDYQVEGSVKAAAILEQHGLCYFAWEVRTGKSLAALATAQLVPGVRSVLFATKKKAIGSVINDYDALAPDYKINVINFEALHQVVCNYDLVIIDEAHTCGAFPSKPERTKQLQEIAKGKPVIFLSGTPTPESYSQLYHQLAISSRSPWSDHTTFYSWVKAGYVEKKKRYVYNREFVDYSNADKDRIKQDTDHIFLSYTQSEAGFEQFVREEILVVDMKPATYTLAQRIMKDRVYKGRNGETVIADTAVKVMNKCHQIFSGTVITDDGNAIAFDHSKVTIIQQQFHGKKIAIFYKFDAEGGMLKYAYAGQWTDNPELFNASDNLVFISQVQSGREGVNLSTADALIMFNIDYSAVSYWQARARMQAKDRARESVVYWLFSRGGIEEKIYQSVMDKKDYTLSYFKKDFKYEGVKSTNQDKGEVGKSRVVRAQDHSIQ
ncbi:SNF2-related protein [Chitinophaga parva]|uniref:SNF2-related protein n=1 Tax=Chitinophaga parva TaxID=2169414 RepID=UPI001402CE60|nr:SNF2-related protein [Chitinophaga parva]